MDESNSPSTGKRARNDWKTLATLTVLPSSAALCVVTFGILTLGPFQIGPWLYLAYFTYVASLIVFLHAAFFFAADSLRDRGKKLDKRIPKYLEYAYAIVISVSLAQIFISAPRLADYLVFVSGDQEALLSRITTQALKYVRDDCGKVNDFYFTEAYCAKMKQIADAKELKEFLFSSVVDDDAFLHHAIGWQAAAAGNGVAIIDKYSPIVRDIRDLQALDAYRNEKGVELSPLSHPAMRRVLASFELCWLGGATGRGAEPSI